MKQSEIDKLIDSALKQELEPSADFLESLEASIDSLAEAQAKSEATPPSETPLQSEVRVIKRQYLRRAVLWGTSVAACVAVVLSLTLNNNTVATTLSPNDTFDDPRLAAEYFDKTMKTLSQKMSKGLRGAARVSFETTAFTKQSTQRIGFKRATNKVDIKELARRVDLKRIFANPETESETQAEQTSEQTQTNGINPADSKD